jgi:phage terminase small subunit
MTTTEPPERLPPRHARFVAEYLEDFNATQAYLRAGYSPRSAPANASRLLHRPEIKATVAEGRRRITEALAIGAERMAREYARIAFANVDDFISADGAVRIDLAKADRAKRAGLVDLIATEGSETRPRQVRINLGKLRALDALTKRLDLFGEKAAPEVSAEAYGHMQEVVEGLRHVLKVEREDRAELERRLRGERAPESEEAEPREPVPEVGEEPPEPIILKGLGPPDPPRRRQPPAPPQQAAPILWRHVSGLHPNAKIILSGGRKAGDPPDSYEALKQGAAASPAGRR